MKLGFVMNPSLIFYNWINRIIKLYNRINLKKNKYQIISGDRK